MEAFSFDSMLKSGMALPTLGLMPVLEITNHTSLSEEKVTKYGQTYNVHVVVKNSPFVITCAMRNGRGHSFNHLGTLPLSALRELSFWICPLVGALTSLRSHRPFTLNSPQFPNFLFEMILPSSKCLRSPLHLPWPHS